MKIDLSFPAKKYRCWPAKKKDTDVLGTPFSRDWTLEDWKLPPNWQEIAIKQLDELRKKYRSVQLYLDICVRCGACADKCQYFLGTQDPNNMPVARQEILRSIYRKYYTLSGKLFGRLAGARELTEEALKELMYPYYYQCSECRRCSFYCPFGIDTAEITMAARELMISIGVQTKYVTEVMAKAHTIGNNLGIPPKAFYATVKFAEEELKDATGVDIKIPINKMGAEVLFVTPSAELFSPYHWGTMIGWAKMFHQIGLDYTLSTYASEGGEFGLFHSYEQTKKIAQRIVDEAKRLGVRWMIGGECGHQWRVWHNFMDTMSGPLDFLEDAVSPITGTEFGTPIVHICEFTADLIKHNKLKLDPSKNDRYIATFADSCNPARAMGLMEEPRYILKHVCNNYVEMEPNASRERCYCCASGGGLLTDEILELRMKAGRPRAEAIRRTGASFVALICAICKAATPPVLDYWKITAEVGGVHQLLGNAIVLEGEVKKAEPKVEKAEAGKGAECDLCGAKFSSMNECCEHAEKEHKIARASCDMCCKEA